MSTTPQQHLDILITALAAAALDQPLVPALSGNSLFVGSGDSLSACLLAEQAGHRAVSAGDLAWTGDIPPRVETVVGVSQSGRTGATVSALETAREAGLTTVAITCHADSPLAETCGSVIVAGDLDIEEVVPASGYLSLCVAVLAFLGTDTTGAAATVAAQLAMIAADQQSLQLPSTAPQGVSVLTLPDMRSAGDFWSLKLIEATGLCVRSVPLEESGHVDYFVGPQPHLTVLLIGRQGQQRHTRLARALSENGHRVMTVVTPAPHTTLPPWPIQLAMAAFGATVAETAAQRWGRPPFRGGEVQMDAQHIQLRSVE